MMKASERAFDSTMHRKVFDLASVTSPIWKDFDSAMRSLRFGHDEDKLESLQSGYGDLSDSVAITSLIRL